MLACFALIATLLGSPVALAGGGELSVAPPDERPLVEAPSGGFTVEHGLYADVYGPPGDGKLVRRLANHAATKVPELMETLGVRPGGTLDIYVLDDQEQFHSLQPGRVPDWADGTTWPRWGLIFLRAPHLRGPQRSLKVDEERAQRAVRPPLDRPRHALRPDERVVERLHRAPARQARSRSTSDRTHCGQSG